MKFVHKNQAFTLVELILALAFVSVLLLAIVTTVMQIATAYNRGMTVKEVNQVGRLLGDDLRSNIGSDSKLTVEENGAISNDSFAQDTVGETPGTGRLCLGGYSYVWNYARVIANEDVNKTASSIAKFKDAPARLVKVVDADKKYCQKSENGNSNFAYTDIAEGDLADARELLNSGDRKLSLYDFRITSPVNSYDAKTRQRLYRVEFVIGSGDMSAVNDGAHPERPWTCKMPGEEGSDLSYCVIQKFNLVIRAGSS